MDLCPICWENDAEYITDCQHAYCIICLSKISKCALCCNVLKKKLLCNEINLYFSNKELNNGKLLSLNGRHSNQARLFIYDDYSFVFDDPHTPPRIILNVRLPSIEELNTNTNANTNLDIESHSYDNQQTVNYCIIC
jgi:hypothetical protein